MSQMQAVVQHRYGGPDTLRYQQIALPAVPPNQVLIRVRAASVNAADALLMRGRPFLMRPAFGLRGPRTPARGRDVAGEVTAVGAKVTGFAVGDRVFAEVEAGSFAEFTVARPQRLAILPDGLDFVPAATVPLAATTALQALRDAGRVTANTRVLVIGAAGGVGCYAVQIALALGAEVTGVCSVDRAALVRSWGAFRVIDYRTEDFTAGHGTWDVILDLVGDRSIGDCCRALSRTGTLVLASGNGGRWLGPIPRMLAGLLRGLVSRRRIRPFAAVARGSDLAEVGRLIETGAVTPVVARTYPLADTAAALADFERGNTGGKLVITM